MSPARVSSNQQDKTLLLQPITSHRPLQAKRLKAPGHRSLPSHVKCSASLTVKAERTQGASTAAAWQAAHSTRAGRVTMHLEAKGVSYARMDNLYWQKRLMPDKCRGVLTLMKSRLLHALSAIKICRGRLGKKPPKPTNRYPETRFL